jgi:hypothetical protein
VLPTGRISKRSWIAAAVLIAAFFFQSLTSSAIKSPTFDEPAHIAAGLSYLQTGSIVANPQHPPLLKELGGLALLAAGIRLPDSRVVHIMETGARYGDYMAGIEVLRDGGPDRVLFWARLPFLLLSSLLGLLVFLWGRQILGDIAALAALFLYAFSPTILAHSYLVTTDAGLAAFTILFFFALWNYLQRPGWLQLLACGAAMGAMLAAKFSAVILPPVALLLMFTAKPPAFWQRAAVPPKKKQSEVRSSYSAIDTILAFLMMCAVATVVVEACYFFPSDPLAYFAGLQRVNADHDPNQLVFMAGQLGHRFLQYFAVVWLLKEPLAALILGAFGLFALLRSRSIAVLPKLFLLAPPAVLFAGYSVAADDLGIRYLIPILPFAYLVGGWGLAALITAKSRWPRALAAVLGLWLLVAAADIYPDHLSYFNELACLPSHASQIGFDGGSRCGVLWLDDHNVDWGGSVKQLATWVSQHAAGRKAQLSYYGSFPPEFEGYLGGQVPFDQLVHPEAPEPGLYAISAHMVARGRATAARAGHPGGWLDTARPIAIVGHAYYIYDVPEAGSR